MAGQRQQGHSGRQSRPRSRNPQHAGRHKRRQPLARHLGKLARQEQRRAPREDRMAPGRHLQRAHRRRGREIPAQGLPRSTSRASCRRANGPTSPARRSTRPKSCCSASAANSPCSTPAAAVAAATAAARAATRAAATAAARHRAAAAAAAGRRARRSRRRYSVLDPPVPGQSTNSTINQKRGGSMKEATLTLCGRPGFSRRDFNRVLAAAGLSLCGHADDCRSRRGGRQPDVLHLGRLRRAGRGAAICGQAWRPAGFPGLCVARKRRCRRWSAATTSIWPIPASYNIKRWKDGKVICRPIDVSRMPEYGNIWERFRTIPDTSFDGKVYFIPWDAGTVLRRLPHRSGRSGRCRRSVLGAALQREVQGPAVDVRHRHHVHRNRRAHCAAWYADYLHLSDEQLAEIKSMLAKQRSR